MSKKTDDKTALKVSIIVRTKDRPLLLDRCIRSIKDQSYKDYEVIIVNNGGKMEHIEKITEKYIGIMNLRVINIEKNNLMEYATNRGLEVSRGKYITLLDDDDTWEDNFLNECVKVLDGFSEIDGVVTQTNIIQEEISDFEVFEVNRFVMNKKLKYVDLRNITEHNQYTTNSFMYRKSIIEKIGMYDETLPVLGDWEFNLKFLNRGHRIKVIQKPISNYHKRVKSGCANYENTNRILHLKYDWKVRERHIKNYLKEGKYFWAMKIAMCGLYIKVKNKMKES